jgi:pyroglutamyl-peptidase
MLRLLLPTPRRELPGEDSDETNLPAPAQWKSDCSLMTSHILITTFSTWKARQTANSSDELLQLLIERGIDAFDSLRRLPVDFELAPRQVLCSFDVLLPRVLVCCGMAEERSRLSIESRAILDDQVVATRIDLEALTADLTMTEISHDAGDFVCNTLYFRVLAHLHSRQQLHDTIFVHVPLLSAENREQLAADFAAILERLEGMTS